MKTITKITVALISIIFISQNLFAVTNYVSKTGGHVSPFDSWANAATNIQAAVDVASSGDIVFVNDGTYYPGSQITVDKSITVKSVNGADKTIIDGSNTNRCFYLDAYSNYHQTNSPIIDGFTITNGYSYNGGGVACSGGTVENCTISGNSSGYSGGGVSCYRGTVENCTISDNSAGNSGDGGGVYCHGGTVENCTIIGNSSCDDGGGVYCYYGGTVKSCTITGNLANGNIGII